MSTVLVANRMLRPVGSMADADIYFLASRARSKLTTQASQPDHNLRKLVSHANMLDNLMDTLVKNRETRQKERQEQIVRQQLAVRAATKAQHEKAAAAQAAAKITTNNNVVPKQLPTPPTSPVSCNGVLDVTNRANENMGVRTPISVYNEECTVEEDDAIEVGSESSDEMPLDSDDSDTDSDYDETEDHTQFDDSSSIQLQVIDPSHTKLYQFYPTQAGGYELLAQNPADEPQSSSNKRFHDGMAGEELPSSKSRNRAVTDAEETRSPASSYARMDVDMFSEHEPLSIALAQTPAIVTI